MFNFRKHFSTFRKMDNNEKDLQGFPPALVFKSGPCTISAGELDELFFGVLLGTTSQIDTELNQFETKVLQQLQSLLQNKQQASKLLPRLPTVLPKVIQALREEDNSAAEIASLIEQDHILVAEVIRLVNSPVYRTRQEITSLKQATIMLGREGLRQLVASAIVRPLLNSGSGHFVKISSKALWEHSEKTAMTASQQCQENEEMRFYAYLAGVLQNIGFMVGFSTMDSIFDGTQAPNSKQFRQQFVKLCRELSAAIASNWSLPESLCEAFKIQAQLADTQNDSSLSTNLYIIDRIVKVHLLEERLKFDPDSAQILLNNRPCEFCLSCLQTFSHE